MSETISIDLGPVIRAVNALGSQINHVSGQVEAVGNYVAQVDGRVTKLQQDFIKMMDEQRKAAALQRALTEIIRVRQEVEQKFGTHKQVRDNMLGILQATDAALVTTNTVSRISEELMLNAPSYWLAPCLVALAAWIANDEKLAIRAVNEAVRRDREKTCLLFALVCRRNGRTETCFEWLSEYLKLQSPKNMKKSVIAFVDAYTNGVFGVDKDRICDEHIAHWMKVLKDSNPDFDREQKEYWKKFFSIIGANAAYHSEGYDALKQMSPEFNRIDAFVGRITAVNNEGGARDQINSVIGAKVDMQKLISDIDDQLSKLVTHYEEGEETKLRDEENELELIKKHRGDEIRAKKEMDAIKSRRIDVPVDFASRLRSAVLEPNAPLSSKKTSYFLLREYIVDAYKEYITENKDAYPEEINLQVKESTSYGTFNWKGVTKNGENVEELKQTIKELYTKERNKAVEKEQPVKWKLILGYICFFFPGHNYKKKCIAKQEAAKKLYNSKCVATLNKLDAALSARQDTNRLVDEFCAKEDWDTIQLKEGK
ncbi:MAG: hypothetical protein IKC35_04860 [Clostridia bacterium]|nr:hypothetical protein [Clostridia bacterium]